MSAPTAGPRTASLSDVGRRRPSNQDQYGEFSGPDGTRLLVCCDGMGGHHGGETASRIAVEVIGETVSAGGEAPEALLRRAFEEANRCIRVRAGEDPGLSGMGTTGVALLLGGDGAAWVAHVGDSRAYRVRDGAIEQLTQDHSIVAEQVRLGVVTPDEAATMPHNELSRAIGAAPVIEVDVAQLDAREGDRFLLCSDGLWNLVSDEEIGAALVRESPELAVTRLVALANQRGGTDNVTVQVLALGDDPVLGSGACDPDQAGGSAGSAAASDAWEMADPGEDSATFAAPGEASVDEAWARAVASARERRNRTMRRAALAAALVTVLLLGALGWLYVFATPAGPTSSTAIGVGGASADPLPAVGAGGEEP